MPPMHSQPKNFLLLMRPLYATYPVCYGCLCMLVQDLAGCRFYLQQKWFSSAFCCMQVCVQFAVRGLIADKCISPSHTNTNTNANTAYAMCTWCAHIWFSMRQDCLRRMHGQPLHSLSFVSLLPHLRVDDVAVVVVVDCMQFSRLNVCMRYARHTHVRDSFALMKKNDSRKWQECIMS